MGVWLGMKHGHELGRDEIGRAIPMNDFHGRERVLFEVRGN